MVSSLFIFRWLPADYFDTRTLGIRWLNVLRKYERLIKADYYRTTETWKEHHPVFQSKIRYSGGSPSVSVWTDDQVYFEIDGGTPVRYATMTPDFEPKTKARVLASFPGKGKMAYYDPKIPRPGIEPRWFSDEITIKYEAAMAKDIDDATDKGLEARIKG